MASGSARQDLPWPEKGHGCLWRIAPQDAARHGLSRGLRLPLFFIPQDIPEPKNKVTARTALVATDLQAVERDFAFVVDADVEALTLVNAAAGADKALITEVRVFDEFIGGSLGEGKKSLAITVRLQPTDATLKDKDIEAVAAKYRGQSDQGNWRRTARMIRPRHP